MVQNNAKFMDLLRATIEQTVEKKDFFYKGGTGEDEW